MSKKAVNITLSVFFFSLVYSLIRYHIFEAIPFKDFALYIMNKCLGLTALTLITFNFTLGPVKSLGFNVSDSWLASRKEIGITSFVMVLSHCLCSLLIFGTNGYYAKFFETDGSLSMVGSWSMLLGVLSFGWLWMYNISFRTPQEGDDNLMKLISSRGSLILVGLLSAGHVVVMGFQGWFRPETWAGNMPPITLVAFAVFLFGFVMNLLARR